MHGIDLATDAYIVVRAQKRVLVIDDEPQVREALRSLFVREGFDVVLTDNGTDAIVAAQQTRMDVVVTDLELPDMSGLAVVQRLRGLCRDACRIVVYTGFGESHAGAALKAGADVVLTKAASLEILLGACGNPLGVMRDTRAAPSPPRPAVPPA